MGPPVRGGVEIPFNHHIARLNVVGGIRRLDPKVTMPVAEEIAKALIRGSRVMVMASPPLKYRLHELFVTPGMQVTSRLPGQLGGLPAAYDTVVTTDPYFFARAFALVRAGGVVAYLGAPPFADGELVVEQMCAGLETHLAPLTTTEGGQWSLGLYTLRTFNVVADDRIRRLSEFGVVGSEPLSFSGLNPFWVKDTQRPERESLAKPNSTGDELWSGKIYPTAAVEVVLSRLARAVGLKTAEVTLARSDIPPADDYYTLSARLVGFKSVVHAVLRFAVTDFLPGGSQDRSWRVRLWQGLRGLFLYPFRFLKRVTASDQPGLQWQIHVRLLCWRDWLHNLILGIPSELRRLPGYAPVATFCDLLGCRDASKPNNLLIGEDRRQLAVIDLSFLVRPPFRWQRPLTRESALRLWKRFDADTRRMLERFAALSDGQIEELFLGIPEDLLSSRERDEITAFILSLRGRLHEASRAA